jgi:phenylpropionate dioxygenase-like ring-hydroxylating dioxygenase large terminal subunit
VERAVEIGLLNELLQHCLENTTGHLGEVGQADVSQYISPKVLEEETEVILKRHPIIVGVSSELNNPGDYVAKDILGQSYLFVRQPDLQIRAFHNVCRHRGARLVEHGSANKSAFVCPYHRWRYKASGELDQITRPEGFAGVNTCDLGLKTIGVAESNGIVFATLKSPNCDAQKMLEPLQSDVGNYNLNEHKLFRAEAYETHSNWKQSIEQFLEIYHIKSIHRDSISRFFVEHVQTSSALGPHVRFCFPRKQILELQSLHPDQWKIRDVVNVTHYIFPNSLLLAQQDHYILATFWPKGPDNTLAEYRMLVPQDTDEAKAAHYEINDRIMRLTIDEDIAVGRSVQQGFHSGVNEVVHFGQYEGSLTLVHRAIDRALAEGRGV